MWIKRVFFLVLNEFGVVLGCVLKSMVSWIGFVLCL